LDKIVAFLLPYLIGAAIGAASAGGIVYLYKETQLSKEVSSHQTTKAKNAEVLEEIATASIEVYQSAIKTAKAANDIQSVEIIKFREVQVTIKDRHDKAMEAVAPVAAGECSLSEDRVKNINASGGFK
jgi:hypothetical protein